LLQVLEDPRPSPIGIEFVCPGHDVEVNVIEPGRLGEHDDVRLLTAQYLNERFGRPAQELAKFDGLVVTQFVD
jgi:hypothetical protein